MACGPADLGFRKDDSVMNPGSAGFSRLTRPGADDSAAAYGDSASFARNERLDQAIQRTTDYLLQRQNAAGYWCAELEGDTILESEYILLLAFIGQGQAQRAQEAATYMLAQQCPHGGWAQFPGGPIEISGSVKAYLALKITGHNPQADYMIRARDAILAAGGVEKINSFTRYYLAMLGLIPYDLCPAVPPEFMLLPQWAPFNIYEMSAWSRTIIVPLSLLWAFRPVSSLPPEHHIDELYATPEKTLPRHIRGVNHDGGEPGLIDWTRFFQRVDVAIKWCEARGWKPLRSRSIKLAEQWILDRLKDSDGLGAIFPPIIWTIIGLRCLNYGDDHPVIQSQFGELEKLVIREREQVRLQPCLSPVWDTSITLIALRDAGVPQDGPAIQRGVQWLLSKEVRQKGDWSNYRPNTEPGGWFFEFNNAFYPDVDDTAMALIALSKCLPDGFGREWSLEWHLGEGQPPEVSITGRAVSSEGAMARMERVDAMVQAMRRGVGWLQAMQSRDGGWGAFDADNTREVFTKVPFADHNAMIDPSTGDITARVLEALAYVGIRRSSPWLERALEFVWNDQEPDGAWFGRWGVNYLYGTWQVLQGLTRFQISQDDARLQRGAEWLIAHQQACGGWGETISSYDDSTLRGQGEPTASQTAWAVLGLVSVGLAEHSATRKGVEYLLQTQQPDGGWQEPQFTGTGFPRVFYLRYHFYRIYFPLMALARYRRAIGAA